MDSYKREFYKRWIIGDPSLKRFVTSALIIIFIIYFYILGYLLLNDNSLIFKPQQATYDKTASIMFLKSGEFDSIAISSKFTDSSKYTILLSHGNAEDLGDMEFILSAFQKNGYNIVSYDYPGYGLSSGFPTEKSCYRAIETVYSYLTEELQINPNEIILFGRSVGGGPSCELARRNKVGGLILESTFTSAYRVLTHFRIFPIDKFNNIQKIKEITVPLLLIHGTDDKVIPISHSRRLFQKANEPRLYFEVENAGHNNVMYEAGETYWETINSFSRSLVSE